jgi:hypothetical protein
MNTNLYSGVLNRGTAGGSLLQKLLIASMILVLLFGSLPVPPALAAPASDGTSTQDDDYEMLWENRIQRLWYYNDFYQRVRVYPADFDDLDELARAHDLLNQYGVALRGAQAVVAAQAGFNEKGHVINSNQAARSLKDLGSYMYTMKVLRNKLDDLEGKYQLLPRGTVTTASQ